MHSRPGASSVSRCAAWLALLPALAALLFTGAHAQALGPFVPQQVEWVGGVILQTIPTTRIWVDQTGDGLDGPGDTHHSVPPFIDATWRLSLSPTRTVMIATRTNGSSCDDLNPTEIRVYKVPIDDSALIPLGYNNQLRCLASTAFDDRLVNTAYRTAVFVENKTSTGSSGHILWWNLVTGEQGRSAAEYTLPLNPMSFAPAGTMASVPNDVAGIGGAHYSPVELCPASIGQASIPGPPRANNPAAYVELGTPDTVVVYRTGGPSGPFAGGPVPYVSCIVPSAPYGACCGVLGCSQTHQADCVGTWTSGQTCADAMCPVTELHIALSGPATAVRGAVFQYTLTASNAGALASSNVSMVDVLPFGATFLSASGAGTYNPSTRAVTWALGTLNGNSQTSRTITVQASCNVSSIQNASYSITGTPGGTVVGSPTLITTVTLPTTIGLSLTLLSSALAPTPLQPGDRVRYTVRIGNMSMTNHDSLSFSVQPGVSSEIAQVVSVTSGSVLSSLTSLSWKGLVPANSTIDVVYETAIKPCRGAQATIELLNRGTTVFLRNVCSFTMATAISTQSFAVAPSPFRLAIESPSHGPVQWWSSPEYNRMIACRPGADLDLDLRLHNSSASASPASVSLALPVELSTLSDSPFIGTPPVGTLWNSGTRTISWSGTAAALDSVVIRFRVRVDLVSCRTDLLAVGGHGACSNALVTELSVLAVPLPPANHLVTLHNSDGLRYQDPSLGTGWQPLLCGSLENSRGMGRAADGTIWVAGQPCFRLNPHQLSFQILPPTFGTTLGMDTPNDVAEDLRDSTLVFSGYQSGLGLRVRRYNPRTGAVTTILNDTSPQTLGVGHRVVVSPDGIIGVNTNSSLMRIDPANPTAYQRYLPPGGGLLFGLTLDLDGSWLTTSHPAGPTAARNLLSVTRDAGAFTTLVDLQPYFFWQYEMPAIVAVPNQDVYVGTYADEFGVVRRGSGFAVDRILDDLSNVDLVWVGTATTSIDEEDGVAARTFGLSAASPNPTRGATTLRFTLPRAAHATLELYDSQGRRVRTLAHGEHVAGERAVGWNGRDGSGRAVRAGVYFARLTSEGSTRRVRLVLTR